MSVLQAGNDFLPNIPSIDIYDKPCGLDLLFAAYKALLVGMGGHLTSGGAINRSRLVQLLVYLARDEEAAYKRRAVRMRMRLLCGCCCSRLCSLCRVLQLLE
jgi:5'-3' exonuclease